MNPRPLLALALVGALVGCGRSRGPDSPPAAGTPAAATSPGGHSMEGMTSASPMAGHGMEGSPGASPAAAAFSLKLTVEPSPPAPGAPAEVALTVTGSGQPVTAFDVVHEKRAHLILISRDLSEFQHLHPDMVPDGAWRTEVTFPRPGAYRFYLDVTPTGSSQQVLRSDLTVSGEASPRPVELDPSPKTVGGMKVELSSDPAELRQGDAMLTFRLTAGGKPVEDLQPYLGAMGHLVIVDESGERFLHAHPLEKAASSEAEASPHAHGPGEEHPPAKQGGPEVTFHTSFPAPGVYKLWGQFQRGGEVLTAPFVVQVQ